MRHTMTYYHTNFGDPATNIIKDMPCTKVSFYFL